MADLRAYFARVKEHKALLDGKYPDGYLFICSVDNLGRNSTAGSVAEVSTEIAAKSLADGTARVATEAEIAEYKRKAEAFAEKMSRIELSQFQKSVAEKLLQGGSVPRNIPEQPSKRS